MRVYRPDRRRYGGVTERINNKRHGDESAEIDDHWCKFERRCTLQEVDSGWGDNVHRAISRDLEQHLEQRDLERVA